MWFDCPELSQKVRKYEAVLNEALDEFNLQFIVIKLPYACQRPFIPDECEERNIQIAIGKVANLRDVNDLDNAYYNMGNRLYMQAGKVWEELQKSEFGKLFCLTQENLQKAMKQLRASFH